MILKNALSVEIFDMSISLLVWQILLIVIAIGCLVLLFKLYKIIKKYVTRFDFDNELQN